MALSLHTNQTPLLNTPPPPKPKPRSPTAARVRCGPRGNRGPLVKGRVLSIEAIQAVQSLKRAHLRPDPDSATRNLSRLIKSDLIAALRELLRQDRCDLALRALSAVRSDHRLDPSLYADLVNALSRNGMAGEIDRLIADLTADGVGGALEWDDSGTKRLVRAVLNAGRRESTVRIYRMLKESVAGSTEFKGDDYLVGALIRGLRRVGEPSLADEVVSQFGCPYKGNFDTSHL